MPLIMPNPQSESEWVNTALAQNLNLLSAQVGTEIGRNEVNIQKSGHYPTLGLQASKRDTDNNSLRSDSGSPFSPADTENISEGIGLQLNIPIYSGGQTSSRVRQAVAQHRSAKEKLEKAGELKRIEAEVDTDLEIAEILRRVGYSKGPAILFENVKGFDIPILGNAFGSMKRLEIGLETSNFSEIGQRIADMTKMDIPSGIFNKIKKLPELSKMSESFPKLENNGKVLEIINEKPSFDQIPIIKSWPKDAGKFITFGMVTTKHPETGVRNLGVYRIQILDSTHALMHWQKHKRGAEHHDIAKKTKNRMDAAIIIGGDPATIFSSIAPVPEGLDKFLFAGITRKKGIKMVKCKTVDLEVPANAEIVLEGYVDSSDMRDEGPFGDHIGCLLYTSPSPRD